MRTAARLALATETVYQRMRASCNAPFNDRMTFNSLIRMDAESSGVVTRLVRGAAARGGERGAS